MAFTDKDDMSLRFGEKEIRELTDRTIPRTNAVVDAVLNKAIATAAGYVKVYLGEQFDLATAEADPPAPLVQVEADIARYLLYKDPPQAVAEKFNQAIDYLKAARVGDLGLGPNSVGAVQARSDLAVVCAPGRLLTNRRLSSYMNKTLPDDCSG